MDGESAVIEPGGSGFAARPSRIRKASRLGMNPLDASDWFPHRHIGPSRRQRDEMLGAVGATSLEALMDEAIPGSIRLRQPLNLPPAESESTYLERLAAVARQNTI